MTTIRQPLEAMGRAAVRAVLALLNGEEGVNNKFDPELIVRQSVAQPRT